MSMFVHLMNHDSRFREQKKQYSEYPVSQLRDGVIELSKGLVSLFKAFEDPLGPCGCLFRDKLNIFVAISAHGDSVAQQ